MDCGAGSEVSQRGGEVRIGIVSDTHIPTSLAGLPDPLLERLAGVERILHAGDLVTLDVLATLSAVAPTTAVVGNMDRPEVARRLAPHEILRLGRHTIGLVHGHERADLQDRCIGRCYDDPKFDLFFDATANRLPEAGIIVFGHFHAPLVRAWQGVLFINPGSVSPPHKQPTFALLTLNGKPRVEILPVEPSGNASP